MIERDVPMNTTCARCGCVLADNHSCPACDTTTDFDTQALLVRELGNLAASAGEKGGDAAGGSGGRLGAEWAATLLKSASYSIAVESKRDFDSIGNTIHNVLASVGKIERSERFGNRSQTSAVVGGGFLNLNPVVVVVVAEFQRAGSTSITIAGTAKEGLIKQDSARKAVERVRAKLTEL